MVQTHEYYTRLISIIIKTWCGSVLMYDKSNKCINFKTGTCSRCFVLGFFLYRKIYVYFFLYIIKVSHKKFNLSVQSFHRTRVSSDPQIDTIVVKFSAVPTVSLLKNIDKFIIFFFFIKVIVSRPRIQRAD